MEVTASGLAGRFIQVSSPDGTVLRFAVGTRAGFAVDRINKRLPESSGKVVCIEAIAEGEEPIEFGPDAELVVYGQSWKLRAVQESQPVQGAELILYAQETGAIKEVHSAQELQDHQGITQFGDTDVNHGEIANENGRYTGRHYFTKHPMKEKKGVCVVCSAAAYGTQTRPTRTTYWCPDCKVRLCHRGMCFQRYHSEPIEHLDFGRKRQRGIRS
ncbi:unnamed protein product [Sphagnum troendelagicum]|uniref:PiggyBac transposable element-derived protein 4 C-terminal zinc-finger domain-containing protein n=3 Tax=Sphagnum TaxID=13804 RepID=A0ABP0UP98_9BRYO